MATAFTQDKATRRVRFRVTGQGETGAFTPGATGSGYEIHTGRTGAAVGAGVSPLLELYDRDGRTWPDGAISADGTVFGCYVHGLFDSPEVLQPLLASAARRNGLKLPEVTPFSMEDEFDRLAGIVRESLDMAVIRRIAGVR